MVIVVIHLIFITTIIMIYLIHITIISIHLIYRNTVWPRMPDSLFPRLFARWTGMLSLPLGDNTLILTAREGVRLWIGHQLVVDAWHCLNSSKPIQIEFTTSITSSPVSLQLEYFSHAGPFGIQFYRKNQQGEIQSLSNTNFLHLPSSALTYTTTQTTYFLDTLIETNRPLLFGPLQSASYSIQPSLPKGLTFVNGLVTGTPRDICPRMVYSVTMTMAEKGLVVSAEIDLEVQMINKPSRVWLEDEQHQPVTRTVLELFDELPSLHVGWEGRLTSFSITPLLPLGIELDLATLTLKGRPLARLPSTRYTLHAENDVGVRVSSWTLEVSGCEEGVFVYSQMGGSGYLEILSNDDNSGEQQQYYHRHYSTVVFAGEVLPGNYSLKVCLERKGYQVRYNCSAEPCRLILRSEEELYLVHQATPLGQPTAFSIDTTGNDDMHFHLNRSAVYTSLTTPVSIPLFLEGSFFVPIVAPALPSSVQLDMTNLTIHGLFPKKGVFRYTITVTNTKTILFLPLAVHVGICPERSSLYEFQRGNSQYGETITILHNETVLYHSVSMGGAFFDLFCIEDGIHRIVLTTTTTDLSSTATPSVSPSPSSSSSLLTWEPGWAPNTDLRILDQAHRLVTAITVPPGRSFINHPLHLLTLLPEGQSIRHRVASLAPPTTWISSTFDDQTWTVSVSGKWSPVPKGLATVYFRKQIVVEMPSPAERFLRVAVYMQEGVVVYVGGHEVQRVNLRTGTVYHSSTATARWSKPRWIDVVVPRDRIGELGEGVDGKTITLAAEVHRWNVVNEGMVCFDVELRWLESPVLYYSSISVHSSNHTLSPDHPVQAVIDGDSETFWEDSLLPTWINVNFVESGVVANQIELQVDRQAWWWSSPSSIGIQGIPSTGDPVTLLRTSSSLLVDRPSSIISLNFSNQRAFPTYRVVFYQTNGPTNLHLAEMAFALTSPVICPEEGKWPATQAGETVYMGCGKRGKVGLVRRTCTEREGQWVWSEVDEEGCVEVSPPYGQAYVELELQVNNCSLWQWQWWSSSSTTTTTTSSSSLLLTTTELRSPLQPGMPKVMWEQFRVLLKDQCTDIEEVEMIVEYEIKATSVFQSHVSLRLSMKRKAVANVKTCIANLKEKMTKLMYSYYPNLPIGMDFQLVGDMVIRQNNLFAWFLYVVVLLLCCVGCWLLFSYWGKWSHTAHISENQSLLV